MGPATNLAMSHFLYQMYVRFMEGWNMCVVTVRNPRCQLIFSNNQIASSSVANGGREWGYLWEMEKHFPLQAVNFLRPLVLASSLTHTPKHTTSLCMIYKRFELRGHRHVLIKHLQIVIPLSYPCHYTNLCPHKPHKPAHTHTHTRWFLWFMGTLHRRNGFYTEQTVCAIALHLPYT